ncbi:MAG: CotH kinase family protein, partial [Prolixibacteraceae bacterium]|nr:CotH kinase family protein [Prolixibacteraceae bacterium]
YFKDFYLKLSFRNRDAKILFTTDGSEPTLKNAEIYSVPLYIEKTTILKATAYFNDSVVSEKKVHTFLFPQDIINQKKNVPGYPQEEFPVNSIGGDFALIDFEMDPDIINNPEYADSVIPALLSIPTVVIGIAPFEFQKLYNNDSIYKTSLEIIYPDKTFGSEQISCGIKSHSYRSLKRSMRVLFKEDYGPKKFKSNILKTSPLNPDNAATEFDHLVFRAGNNHCWARFNVENETTYTRDQWCRDTQLLMTGDGVHGTFVHLYINGLYWGLYNLSERPDENFLEDYYGGTKNNWISLSHSKWTSNKRPYNYLANKLLIQNNTEVGSIQEIKDYIDLGNYSDYLNLSWYTGVFDWPGNNWWAGIHSNPDGKLKFFTWDYELTFDNMSSERTVPSVFREDYNGTSVIVRIWNKLKQDNEFLLFFADRVYENCYHGWLSPEKATKTWDILNNYIRLPIIAESARWGDAVYPTTKTKNDNWIPEVNRINNVLKTRNEEFIAILKSYGFYPAIDPPQISCSKNNNHVITVQIINPNSEGNIFYTINDKDPRNQGGSLYSNAKKAGSDTIEFETNKGILIKSRILEGNTWSALNEFPVIPVNNTKNLLITEIMFSPDSLNGIKGKFFEFIELKNTGDDLIDISGIKITGGIDFAFPDPTYLYPDQFYILAKDETWFHQRYGFYPDGVYRGKLNNKKESFSFSSSEGKKLMEVNYNIQNLKTDLQSICGFSIIPKTNRGKDLSKPGKWEISPHKNGSPGLSEN